ncbi:MAG: AsmA-like C-terminal domain-containing protein [Desulfobulbaceae bacterium]|nr:AsmA-like C-terminal domain-containing protein [Desulfobulbaceae bacterium]
MEGPINPKSRRLLFFLLLLLCVLALAGTAGWQALKKGIEIDRLSFASVNITQLFLQINRGLIVHVEQIEITADDASRDNGALEKKISLIKKWGHLIREIHIPRLKYLDRAATVDYHDGNFRISGDEFVLQARVSYAQGTLHIDLDSLDIHPYRIVLSGKASYTRRDDRFLYSGFFETPWGKGELRIGEQDGRVEAQISTGTFSGLAPLLQQFPLDEEVTTWISENISASSYKVNYLLVQFPLQKIRDIGPENIHGYATAESAAVRFHPDLPPVECDRIKVTYQDDRLSFALENPHYRGKSLEGSAVFIDNIIKPDSVLAISIKTESRLDPVILNLLETYDVKLPLQQHTGITRGEMDLRFDLPEFEQSISGAFVTASGSWTWEDIPLQATGASVRLRDDEITIDQAEIAYGNIFHTRFSGLVDTSARHASLLADIEHLHLTAKKTTLVRAAHVELPLEIDYSSESTMIASEQIRTYISITEGRAEIDIDNLTAVKPMVPILQTFPFSEGNVHLAFNNPSYLEFTGELNIPGSLLSQDAKPVTLFRFQGTRTPDETRIAVNDNRMLINITDRLQVNINEYLATVDIPGMKKDSEISSLAMPLVITGPQVLLKMKDFHVPIRQFAFKAFRKDMSFMGELEKGRIQFLSTEEKIHLVGTGLDAMLAEKFIRFTDLSEGLIDVNLEGDSEGYNGYLRFSNVVIREYLLMNNILAFLNSIPALATLSKPGFDQEGYRVKEGIVYFDLLNNLLTIRQLRTDGTTVNCEAYGWIDFAERTLKLNMELITFMDYSKIINILPWAGYAILGEDGSLSTSLKIDGSLDEPQITTYMTRDIIMTPINVLRRTIEWPFKILGEMGETEQEAPERIFPAPVLP